MSDRMYSLLVRAGLWIGALLIIGLTWMAYDQPSLQLAMDTVFTLCGFR